MRRRMRRRMASPPLAAMMYPNTSAAARPALFPAPRTSAPLPMSIRRFYKPRGLGRNTAVLSNLDVAAGYYHEWQNDSDTNPWNGGLGGPTSHCAANTTAPYTGRHAARHQQGRLRRPRGRRLCNARLAPGQARRHLWRRDVLEGRGRHGLRLDPRPTTPPSPPACASTSDRCRRARLKTIKPRALRPGFFFRRRARRAPTWRASRRRCGAASADCVSPRRALRGTGHRRRRGCSSMVEQQPSKLNTRVRFPSPAPVLQ